MIFKSFPIHILGFDKHWMNADQIENNNIIPSNAIFCTQRINTKEKKINCLDTLE
jgi:hypothetical protein